MSKGDIKIVDTGGLSNVPTYEWQVAAGAATSIEAGEPVKLAASHSQYVVLCADADLDIGTDQPFVGIAASDSTDTASADGVVQVYMPLPGIVYEIKAKTATAVDTTTEINALRGDKLCLDLTSSAFTMDTAFGNGSTHAFLIVGGDTTKKTLKFMVSHEATINGRAQV